MKFTRSIYPDTPTFKGSPCWIIEGRWVHIDADWNTRFPFGTSFGLHVGRHPRPGDGPMAPGFLLDLNAPLHEPNRLYLWFGKWHITIGLVEFRDFRATGREQRIDRRGKMITVVHGEHFTNWLHPHIAGIVRYRYHKSESGEWVPNDKPEPFHWGWLTIEKKR